MDIDSNDLWKELLPTVLKRGPNRLLERIADERGLDDVLATFIETESAPVVLKMFRRISNEGSDADEEALDCMAGFCSGETTPDPRVISAKDLAMRVFDSWVSSDENAGAMVSLHVIGSLGKKIAVLAFDSGAPGTGQVISAYSFRGTIYLLNDVIGVYACHGSLDEVLEEWKQFEGEEIWCPSLTKRQVRRFALRPRPRSKKKEYWRTPASVDEGGATRRPAPLRRINWDEEASSDKQTASQYEQRGDQLASDGDPAGAVTAWRFAASKGSADAHWKLAAVYRRGRGVKADVFEAARRCRSAAEWGHEAAVRRIKSARARLCMNSVTASSPDLITELRKQTKTAAAIERLTSSAATGDAASVVTLIGLLMVNGRVSEVQSWIPALLPLIANLKIQDALVLEVSGAAGLIAARDDQS